MERRTVQLDVWGMTCTSYELCAHGGACPFWAFFYNLVMIPLAVLGLMHPALAEVAMATSSVTVVKQC